MSAPARRAKVERTGADLSVRRQCQLLDVARSGVYRPRPEPSAADLALMRRIDELYLEKPFYGSRRMTFDLNEEGRGVNRKRVQRPMRLMGLEGLVPRPARAKPHRVTRSTLTCCAGCRSPRRTMCGRPTSPTFRWPAASCIWWLSSTGRAARCWPGGCRTRWTAHFASRPWRRLYKNTANRG